MVRVACRAARFKLPPTLSPSQLNLAQLYHSVPAGTLPFALRCVACRSGQRWQALVQAGHSSWVLFDGSCARRVGTWEQAVNMLGTNGILPVMFFYEAVA